MLLERNKLWYPAASQYLKPIIDKCESCLTAFDPFPSQRVSITSLNRSFNEIVCLDQFFLDDIRLFPAMDTVSRYSTCQITPTASRTDSIIAFEASWLSQFCNPQFLQSDSAFSNYESDSFIKSRVIRLQHVPHRRHDKNPLESKRHVIRSIYLKLKHASPKPATEALSYQAVTVSNDLYGSDTVSSFEIAKGFTKPIDSTSSRSLVCLDIVDAHEQIISKRRLNMIIRSNTVSPPAVKPGDMVQVFYKLDNQKRGKCLSPRNVQIQGLSLSQVLTVGQLRQH